MLADSLRAVMCQYLMKREDGPGRVLAVEVMVNNEAVANLIRKGKAFQLPSVISTSREQGMQSMDSDLERLMKEGMITAEDAYVKAASKKDFEPFVDEEEKKAQAAKPKVLVTKAAAPPPQSPTPPPAAGNGPQRPAAQPSVPPPARKP